MADTPDPESEKTTSEKTTSQKTAETVSDTPFRAGPAPDARSPVTKPRASLVPMVIGGVVAAGLGFGLAQVVPQGWPLTQVSDLSAQVTAQAESIAALQTKLADLAAVPAAKPDPALSDRLAAVEAAVTALPPPVDTAALTQKLQALEQRLAGMTTTPGTTSTVDSTALAQVQAEIAALKTGGTALDAKIADATAKLDSITADAQGVMASAASRAALQQLQAALDSGAPYASALADLQADIPTVLTAHAASGLPSLQTLRAAYPEAARAALDASLRATAGDSWTDRIGTFLRGQTGARSLTPRAGDDPDAVLSRAEAAVMAGDLTTALTELGALPQAGRDAMTGWLDLAAQRQDAVAAVQTLSASVGQ